jgi:hypothetical protein
MQLIDATEVMLRGGHKGTKTQSTIACRLAFSSIPHIAPEFPPSIHRGSRPGWMLRGESDVGPFLNLRPWSPQHLKDLLSNFRPRTLAGKRINAESQSNWHCRSELIVGPAEHPPKSFVPSHTDIPPISGKGCPLLHHYRFGRDAQEARLWEVAITGGPPRRIAHLPASFWQTVLF